MIGSLRWNRYSRAITSASVLIAIAGFASALFGSAYSVYFRTPFPFQDMVETMAFLDGNPAIWFGESFTGFHDMEHRPALPAFIWYADRLLSGSSGLMPLLVSHISLFGISLLAVWNWIPRPGWKRPATWVVPAAATAMMFSLSNWYNLVWEKQLHVSMSLLFLLIAAHFAALVSPSAERNVNAQCGWNLTLAAISSCAAQFSFGYGLAIMPVITVHGALARWPRRYIAVSAGLSVIFSAAYYTFFSMGGRSPMESSLAGFNTVEMLAYMARFLAGMIAATELHHLVGMKRETLPLVAGLAMMGLYVFGAGRLYMRSILRIQSLPKSHSVSLILSSACVAIALMTYLSRPAETGGLVDRYYIVSTLFILSLPGLFVRTMLNRELSTIDRMKATGLAGVFIMLSLLGHNANSAAPYDRWHRATIAAIGADMGIYLPESEALIGPPLHGWKSTALNVWASHRRRLMKRDQYRPFGWRNQRLVEVFDNRDNRHCVGSVQSIVPVPGYDDYFAFAGWAHQGPSPWERTNWIIVVDENDRIVGLGAPGRRSAVGKRLLLAHFPGAFVPLSEHAGFAGYVMAIPGEKLRFLTGKNGETCTFDDGNVPDQQMN